VHRTYVLIEELTAASESWAAETTEESSAPDRPRQGEAQGETYRPLVNFVHRGSLEAARVSATMDEKTQSLEEPGLDADRWDEQGAGRSSQRIPGQHSFQQTDRTERASQARSVDPDLNKEPDTGMTGGVLSPKKSPRVFFYDEWDGVIQDYRNQWCRVIEQAGSGGSSSFVERTKMTYGGTIRTIRRYFEGIRPVALQRMRRQRDGEEVDMEAAIESLVDRQAQTSPTEDVYIRRDRRERDVAVAFLVDLSGSTGRQIGTGGTRVIDVEKEAIVLLAEALEAIGDQYALYGFSGQSRREIQFQVLKDFEERYGPAIWERIDAVRPLEQNRDGAAIRHAAHRLSSRSARVKLLVLLSDGRPLDDLYADEYALEDTKAALREAKAKGVHVFCITVDDGASGYLGRMYGDVSYMIIDRVQSLPERLPGIYRMLTT
jgi:nitric oxide reductase activation protein